MKKILLGFTCDADHGTERSLKEGFRLLEDFGIKVTFSAFLRVKLSPTGLGRHCNPFETGSMTQRGFMRFVEGLAERGHEIALHGYSQVSDSRARVEAAFQFFSSELGIQHPVYIEHGGLYGHHRKGMVKKESLNFLGAGNPKSRYYVADILRERALAVWKHPLLTDPRDAPILQLRESFFDEEGITYFWRSRAHQLNQVTTSSLERHMSPPPPR